MISKSVFFRLSSLAFIVLVTPVLGVYLHSPGGFLLILALAVLVGVFENSITPTILRMSKIIIKNKLLIYFSLWYSIFVIINLFLGGNGLDDWRLMLSPLILIIGILFAFAFMSDSICGRYLQIGIILSLGVQSIINIPQLYLKPSIAREMWAELSGSWIYGNQSYFATCVILLPVLFWRSFKETGFLKLILLLCCSLILISAYISSFGTPLGLILLDLIVTLVFALLFMVKKRGWVVAVILLGLLYSGYQLTSSNPLFSDAYTRITNFISDPTSGGYSGRDFSVSRWYLDLISIESFRASPLLGMGGGSTRYSPYVGGHSSLLDSLGAYGVLGGGGAFAGLIVILLVNAVTRFLHERTWQALLILTTVISLVVAGIVNPYWEGTQTLFVLLVARPFKGDIQSRQVPV
jgi:hypothetical protein